MKILVPVDGSKNSLKAIQYAAKLAQDLRSKSSIVVISVHDDSSLSQVASYVGKKEVENYLIETSETQLKAAQKALAKSKVAHSFIIEIGHIAETILKVANKEKCDLIVMGSKGRSAIADLLLGSVAQRVTSKAKQPVVLVK
jgi:nucleotide-binding universal stress UspA family protein